MIKKEFSIMSYQPAEKGSIDEKIENTTNVLEEIRLYEKSAYPVLLKMAKDRSIFLYGYIKFAKNIHLLMTLASICILISGIKLISNFPRFAMFVLIYFFLMILRTLSYKYTPLLNTFIDKRTKIFRKHNINSSWTVPLKWAMMILFVLLCLFLYLKHNM